MPVSKALRYQILRRDNHTCRYCGRSAPEVKLTVDHVVPETLGGSDDPTNLAAACADCNGGKSATPPDATQVAQVATDAARWAAAIRAASAGLLADFDRRAGDRQAFANAWHSWDIAEGKNRRSVALPGDWAETIDRFVALGLPLPVLIDNIAVAMTRKQLPEASVFKYVCGMAWRQVRDLQEAARGQVAGASEEHDTAIHPYCREESRNEFAAQVVDRVDPVLDAAQARIIVQQANEWLEEPLDERVIPGEQDLGVFMAIEAVDNLVGRLSAYRATIRQLFDVLPYELVEHLRNEVEEILITGDDTGAPEDQVWALFVARLGSWLGDPERGRSAVKRRLSELHYSDRPQRSQTDD